MFDFHMHSRVSFDGRADAAVMVAAAEKAGLREICFTDHMDYDPLAAEQSLQFDADTYRAAYDDLQSKRVKIRRGMEFGMLPDNALQLKADLQKYPYDFVIGSVHFADGLDIFYDPYWQGKNQHEAERRYLENILACVQHHEDYHVLGHLTYISKAWANPAKRPVAYTDHREVIDEILCTLAAKGKGMEINTSDLDKSGDYLPPVACLRRFKELGGEIVTVGSDAHDEKRVGQYCREAAVLVQEIFGHVCTFEAGNPVFHRL